MILNYQVHAVHDTQVPRQVQDGDETVTADVWITLVELTPVDDPLMGTLTLRFRGRDRREAAKVAFVQDATVQLSFPDQPQEQQ